MTHLTTRELMATTEADDRERRWKAEQEQQVIESPEAEEARWSHKFAAMAKDREAERTYWRPRTGTDSRLFGP